MPELPEVETVVRGLRAPLVGRTIHSVWTDNPKVVRAPGLDEFAARIQGRTVRAIHRRAKYILCELDEGILAVHLKMTGRLYVKPLPAAAEGESLAYEGDDRWIRLRLELDNGEYLFFSDARRFGGVYLISDIHEIAPHLGPEPLEDDFTVEVLRERLAGRHRAIKALLLEQSFIAGVGNIYADESLHRAGIHPLRPADSLSDDEVGRLYTTIREALSAGIDYEGASINWYRKPDGTQGESQKHFYVYGREEEPCLTCGTTIRKIRVSQRGTHYCPTCQPER
jgi:formamidopyrimidine-DNA glycosylase